MNNLPQINDELNGTTYTYRQPDLTYKLNEDSVNGKVTKLDSIKQSVYHILMTERYSNPIYGDNYGVELEQYIGKDLGFIVAGIENTLKDALLQDDRITDIVVTDVSKSSEQQNACLIQFVVYTIYGNYNEEINIKE